MVVSCCAVNCANRHKKGSSVGFYRFPADPINRRKEWIKAVSRLNWSPSAHDRLCGDHFVRKKPSDNPDDIDYVPTVFNDHKGERAATRKRRGERSERLERRKRLKEEAIEAQRSQEAAATLLDLSRAYHVQDQPTSLVDIGVNTCSDPLESENQKLKDEATQLRDDVDGLMTQMKLAEDKLPSDKWGVTQIKDNDHKTRFYTGLPSWLTFLALFQFLEPKASRMTLWCGNKTSKQTLHNQSKVGRKRKLALVDEFFSVLMRLRLGLLVEDVADRFQISSTTMSRLFNTWILFLARELPLLFPWPSQQMIQQHASPDFATYPNTRIIIDCTEIFIQRPTSLASQCLTFSSYKHHNTFKVLVGISPGGVITFVSNLWGGRVSDRAITEQCGLLDLLDAGDRVIADRGFDIQDLLAEKMVALNIPPFLGDKLQLSARQVEETRRIAAIRIHVERAIGRIKSFRILQGVLPLSLAGLANDIFHVCAYLSNFYPPLLRADQD